MKSYTLLALFAATTLCKAQNFDTPTVANANKCLETKVIYNNNGSLDYEADNTFDASMNLIRKVESFSRNLNGPYTMEYDYEYDAKGNNTKVVVKQNGVQKNIILKEYSITGKLVKETLTKDGITSVAFATTAVNALGGNTIQKTTPNGASTDIKQLDKLGNLISQEILDNNGKAQMTTTNVYNALGKITNSTFSDVIAKVVQETTYNYDAQGNLISEKVSRNSANAGETTYLYDNQNNLTKKTHSNRLSQTDYVLTFEYDKKKNIIKQGYLDGNSTVVSYVVNEYDGYNNKIKESIFNKNNVLTGSKTWEFVCK